MTFEEAMEKINSATDKNVVALDLFGKRGATAGVILAETGASVDELTKQLELSGGAAEKMARVQLNTLTGRAKIAKSAIEGWILSLDSGNGIISISIAAILDLTAALFSTESGTDAATSAFREQEKTVNNLESVIVPLLERHDELLEKTELTKDEQVELDEIIKTVAEDIPAAVTAFDKYGKALGITTDAARAFIVEQKAILKIRNKEAIDEQIEAIVDLQAKLETLALTLEKVNGAFVETTFVASKHGAAIKVITELTGEEIARRSQARQELGAEIKARQAIIKQLKGEETAAEKLKREQEEALKAAAALVVAEDDLGDSTEKTKDAFQLLQAEIAKVTRELELQALTGELNVETTFRLTELTNQLAEAEKLVKDALADVNAEELKAIEGKAELIKLQDSELTGADLFSKFKDKEAEKDKARRAKQISDIQLGLQTAGEVANSIGAIFAGLRERELQEIDAQLNSELDRLQQQLDNKLISEEQFEDGKSNLQEEALRERNKALRKQAELEKTLAIFNAIINTAVAVTANLSVPVVAALVAILGAAEVAAIVAQPIPEFAEGTEFLDDPKAPQGKDTILMYGDRGEAVINARSNAKYPGLAKAFNENNIDRWVANSEILQSLAKNKEMAFADRLASSMLLQAKLDDGNLLEALTAGRDLDRKIARKLITTLKEKQRTDRRSIN